MDRSVSTRLLACVVVILGGTVAHAGLGPESVLLVVNARSEASVTIANEYVRLRDVPQGNVLFLEGVTHTEQLSVDDFRGQILQPVLQALEDRKLKSQVHCVVYSADLPTAIHVNGDIAGRNLPQILTPVGSINGLTFLHQFVMAKNIRYLDLNANFYARRPVLRSSDTPWHPGDMKRYAEALTALQVIEEPSSRGQIVTVADALRPLNDPSIQAALAVLFDLKKVHAHSPELLYNLACSLAVLDRPTEAITTLSEALEAGWYDHRHASRDPDLKSLRQLDEFKTLLTRMKEARFDVQPTIGFRSDRGWLPNGESSSEDAAPRYLLSTVLGVTAGRGNIVTEVIDGLERSAAADGTRPKGTVYYMRNGDIRSTTREGGFASAVDQLKAMGIDAVIEDGVLPQQKSQVAGAMIGIADFDWRKSESKILPGAIVEHLTSFGGVMTAGAGQTPLSEFLRHGAAGASGTVTEPYALQAKFPHPFIHVHYARGLTLAETFYQSVTGPYQLLVVGDPLCAPWRRDLSVEVKSPSKESPWNGLIRLQPSITSRDSLRAVEFQLLVNGHQIASTSPDKDIEFDTTRLEDGVHKICVVARCADAAQTMGRWSADIEIRNGPVERKLNFTAILSGASLEAPFGVEASCPGATEFEVTHLGRRVAKIVGESGHALIDPAKTGRGTVMLQPTAIFSDGTRYRGRKVLLDIVHRP